MNSEKTRFLSFLGICRKAGKVICGTPLICDQMGKKIKPQLVVIASDASENSVKKLTVKSEFYNIRCIISPATKAELSRAVGKESELAALAITEKGLAAELLKLSGKEVSDHLETGI